MHAPRANKKQMKMTWCAINVSDHPREVHDGFFDAQVCHVQLAGRQRAINGFALGEDKEVSRSGEGSSSIGRFTTIQTRKSSSA